MIQLRNLAWLCVAASACDRPTVTTAPKPSSDSSATLPRATSPSASVATLAPPALESAAPPEPKPPEAERTVVTFDDEAVGGPSRSFEAAVGDWYVASAADARGLEVDGGKWRSGTPSASLADQAKRLYGNRYAEFLDGVKAFAFFPFAVWTGEPPSADKRVSVRFFPFAGQIDQAAGIAFDVGPNGSYLGVRANALEDNLLFFRVVKGKRTIIDNVRDVPTPSKVWHTLSLELRGPKLSAMLDGKPRFEKTLDAVPRGRIGLWSKADSQVLFDDFKVEALPSPDH
ncbi:MAG TPA: hypothetical protein VFK05_14150 [Polyangiaceae bacterium]|nr:hypothetical protein [Polyangiaceae bacterium]